MKNRKIENREVLQFTLQEGADLVGIVNVKGLKHCNPWRPPTNIVPEAKSIVVFALKHSDAALDSDIMRLNINDTLVIYHELSRIGYRISRFLEKRGFRATAVPPFSPIEMSEETRGLVGDFSLRHAADSAGLGYIGRNNLLVTPEFGPRVRLAAVITDGDLEPRSRSIELNCGTCAICIEKCPAKAISQEGVDIRLCTKMVGGEAGLGSMIRFLIELTDKSKEEMKKIIRSPLVWNYYQALQVGVYYGCDVCMRSCPQRKKEVKIER